jgi:C-terminal processing protease CtpA/Prc
MTRSAHVRLLFLLLALVLAIPGSAVLAQDATPEVSPASGEGSGPVAVTGSLSASNFAASAIYQKPTVALLDITDGLPQQSGVFVSDESQILGYATSPLFQAGVPGTFEINLPIEPTGATIGFGDDTSGGVQVFQVVIGNNVIGNAFLQQVEQRGLSSTLYDSLTGNFVQGNLLVFAADAGAFFPSGAGPDGQWFTGDDELAPLEPGYTVVHLAPDGTSTIDRGATPAMDIVEDPAEASLDLSGESILDSYNALIDRLAERYAFTELRGIDWEAIRAQYLPMVQDADANNDLTEYAYVLISIADGIHDAHVGVLPATADAVQAYRQALGVMAANLTASVGATTMFVPNPDNREDPAAGTVQVVTVGESCPAHDAGWVPGTEIVSIDGKSLDERRAEIPVVLLGQTAGTEAHFISLTSQAVLDFAPGQQVSIEYRLPDEEEVRSVSMVAGTYPIGAPAPVTREWPEDSAYYERVGEHTVIHWDEFTDDFPTKVAIFEEALKAEQANPSQGIILDMRGNGGGWAGGYITLASYFYAADNPLQFPVFENWTYNEQAGSLVKEFDAPLTVSSPNPDIAYTGPLTVLVDEKCGSSCEFFSQTLQKTGRAQVIGQYATAGAGGNIDQVTLPGGFIFQYTVGRSYYAGTDELNIEGKGVTPDIWLPVTIETELAKLADPDFVLNLTIAAISPPAEDAGATPVAATSTS